MFYRPIRFIPIIFWPEPNIWRITMNFGWLFLERCNPRRLLHPNIFIGLHFSFSLNRQFRHFFTLPWGVKSFIGLTLEITNHWDASQYQDSSDVLAGPEKVRQAQFHMGICDMYIDWNKILQVLTKLNKKCIVGCLGAWQLGGLVPVLWQ